MSWNSSPRFYKLGHNLIKSADDLTATAWSKLDAGDVMTTGVSAVNAPFTNNGFTGINGIAGDATSGQHGVSQGVLLSVDEYEFTCIAKIGNKNFLYLKADTNKDCYFNISSGVRATVGSSARAAKITPLAGGWYKCSFRFTGTAATYTLNISPTDADASTTMTGGDGATVNVYIIRPQICKVNQNLKDENDESILNRVTDEGATIIGGWDGIRAHTAEVAHANSTSTVDTKVLKVQHLDSTGAVLPSGSSASTAPYVRVTDGTDTLHVQVDGSAATANGLAVGGTDGTNYQHLSVDSSGAIYNIPKSVPTYEDTAAGEAACRIKGVSGTAIAQATGAVINTVAGDLLTDPIVTSTAVGNYSRVSVEVYNAGGGTGSAIDRIIVYGSNSGTNWGIAFDSGTGLAWATGVLGTGSGAYLVTIEANAFRYIKVGALCAAGDTTAEAYIYGN